MLYNIPIDYRLISDKILRKLIISRLNKYNAMVSRMTPEQINEKQELFREYCSNRPMAINTLEANKQHYEVPAEFFTKMLSKHMKYSGSIWQDTSKLNNSDENTLKLYANRTEINDGDTILELGAGWGALSLYIAQNFKNSFITAVTNSKQQKQYISTKIKEFNLTNMKVILSDVNDFDPQDKFDRIMSIEMFEHLRNPSLLFKKIDTWLTKNGKLFIQVFSHREYPQFFDNTRSSWMAKNFFTGGMMPYAGFYRDICKPLSQNKQWTISGSNYHYTLEAWLKRLDDNNTELQSLLRKSWPHNISNRYINRYRLFLLICSELFKYNDGKDWHIMHYLFSKKS